MQPRQILVRFLLADAIIDWLQSLKQFFHQCVIPYTCSQPNSDGSVVNTLMKKYFKDWSQSNAIKYADPNLYILLDAF